eukprot:GFUD01073978.1.p1 GENE.GFUD01073978.1~~GFUD01073978.1.p1  ORF type:complete len:190 (+),score=31.35 GFUD01073978.1:38-607(+)
MYKLLIASCVAAAATAAPSADAEPGYLVGAPALLNAYPNWPGVSTPYASSTCYGCRPALHYGKRSAEADPGYLAYGYGYPLAYGYGLHAHGHATSFEARSPQGLGKRSADAEPGYGYYGFGVPLGLPYNGAVHGINQLHPTGHSFQHIARGKRSAEAEAAYGYYGYPYAHHGYGYAHGYGHGYGYGYHG